MFKLQFSFTGITVAMTASNDDPLQLVKIIDLLNLDGPNAHYTLREECGHYINDPNWYKEQRVLIQRQDLEREEINNQSPRI